jgi:hypothetical protein
MGLSGTKNGRSILSQQSAAEQPKLARSLAPSHAAIGLWTWAKHSLTGAYRR